MRSSKPKFQSVVDLGLRDVGVRNEPRRIAARLGMVVVALLALIIVSTVLMCALLVRTGVHGLIVAAFGLGWLAAGCYLTYRALRRSAPVVVKVNAEGTNHATWLLIAHAVLIVPSALLVGGLFVLPPVVLAVLMAVLVWRARGRVPEALRELRARLGADEAVLGDGIGMVRGVRNAREACRIVVATDRRLLVATLKGPDGRLLIVDAPYREVDRFGIEWKQWGGSGCSP